MVHNYQIEEIEMIHLESDSDDEIEILALFTNEEERFKRERVSTSRRGSVLDHKVIKRDYLRGQKRFFRDYFAKSLVSPPHLFQRKFRMSHPRFSVFNLH
jgi:hypothetical protein